MGVTLAIMLATAARSGVPATGASATPGNLAANDIAAISEPYTQHGFSAEGIEVDLVLATPEFFRLTGRWQEAVDLGADKFVVLVFNIHHHGALDDDETIVPILQLDGSSFHVATDVRHLADDGHHRSDALIFRDLPATLMAEPHNFDVLLPPGPDGTRPTFRWVTPIENSTMMPMGSASPMPMEPAMHEASPMVIATPTALEAPLTRSGQIGDGTAVDVLLAPLWFFRETDRIAEAQAYGADRVVVFIASEHHYHGAPPLAPTLCFDGDRDYTPTEVQVLSEDGHHHRISVLIFADLPAGVLGESHTLELLLPPKADGSSDTLVWQTPLVEP